MKKKLIKWLGLKLAKFGVQFYDNYPVHLWDHEDRVMYAKLSQLKREFEK